MNAKLPIAALPLLLAFSAPSFACDAVCAVETYYHALQDGDGVTAYSFVEEGATVNRPQFLMRLHEFHKKSDEMDGAEAKIDAYVKENRRPQATLVSALPGIAEVRMDIEDVDIHNTIPGFLETVGEFTGDQQFLQYLENYGHETMITTVTFVLGEGDHGWKILKADPPQSLLINDREAWMFQ